jgi:hypothetical protein
MSEHDGRDSERHYPDPEILPPLHKSQGETERGPWRRVFIDEQGTRRIYVTKVGPLGLLSFSAFAGFLSVILLILFLGAFVLLLPLLGILFGAAVIAGLLRRFSRRSH